MPTVSTKKLLTVKQNNECRIYVRNKERDAFSEGRLRQIPTTHAFINKRKVRNIQSAFGKYVPSIILENKHFEVGKKGLEMIAPKN